MEQRLADAGTVERAQDRDFVAGLGKGLAVIECFDDRHQRLTIAEVAGMTALSRAAARRCLMTLQRLGYARFDGKFYWLTPRVLKLGHAYLASSDLPQLIQPFLEHVSNLTQESCSASILDGTEIVYIARSAKKRIMTVNLAVSSRLPAYCSSMGRVLLAALTPDDALRRLQASDRRTLTPHTRTDMSELSEIIAQVRAQGYCVVDQELETGLVSIAVPLVSAAGETIAAMNIGTQTGRVSAADIAGQFLPLLRDAQANLRPLFKAGRAGIFT
jgi:IclR family pca regulon transcriptional regulator